MLMTDILLCAFTIFSAIFITLPSAIQEFRCHFKICVSIYLRDFFAHFVELDVTKRNIFEQNFYLHEDNIEGLYALNYSIDRNKLLA